MRFGTAVPVAAGATGRVVRAFDQERGEDVALKLLHRDDPAWVQRMLREAEVQMRLDHPHICPVYGTGRLGEQPYIAMRYIDGQTLDAAAAGLADRDKAALVAQVADAIAYAHRHGVVHRDLKPSNILVERRDRGKAHAIVVDFGLVHDVDAPELTRTGQLLGTPGYMAPEQATAAARVDGRADIYSLGVILFELLAGRRPFTGESAAEILIQTLRAEPPALASLRPDIDPALARVVCQCLETDPRWRYATADALRADLLAFGEGRRVTARRDTRMRRMQRFARRHPWRAGLGTAAAVLALGLVGATMYSGVYAARQSEAAQRYLEFAAGIENAMRLEYMKPPHDVAPVRQRLQVRVAEFEATLPRSGPAARRTGQLALGRALFALGDAGAAREYLEAARDAGEDSLELHASLGEVLLRTYFEALQATSTIPDADLRRAAVEALDRDHRAIAREHLHAAARAGTARALQMQGLLEYLDGNTAAAERHLLEAADAMSWPVDALLLAGGLAEIEALRSGLDGETGLSLARLRIAFERYRRAAEIARSHAPVAAAQCRAGGSLITLRRHGADIADPEWQQALAACDRAIALDGGSAAAHAAKAQAHADLGLLMRQRGRWTDADFEPAIGAARTALALDPGHLEARRALGALLTQRAFWQAERGDAGCRDTASEAIAVLAAAQASDPGSPEGAMMLANAHFAAARSAVVAGGDGAAHMTAAERVLARAADAQGAPLVLEFHLIDTQTWHGFERYMAGEDATGLLESAVARARALAARAPHHPKVHTTLGMAAWTLADFEVMVGRDSGPSNALAVEAYRRAIAREDVGFADLFNAVSALQMLAAYRLDRDQDASGPIAELERWTARLRDRSSEEHSIDAQLAALHHLRGRQMARDGADPLEEWQRMRTLLEPLRTGSIDAREAQRMLAEVIAHEHAWRRQNGRTDAARAEADERLLLEGARQFPDLPTLHATTARALLALPSSAARREQARVLLAAALAQMPLLAGAQAESIQALGMAAATGVPAAGGPAALP